MGVIDRLLERREVSDLGALEDKWYQWPILDVTSGVEVTPDTALSVTAIWQAVSLIAGTIATLPLKLYRTLPTGGKEHQRQSEINRVLQFRPNAWQTPTEFKEMLTGHAVLRGKAYAQILMAGPHLDSLIPLHPDNITEEIRNKKVVFVYRRVDGTERVFAQNEIFLLRGPFGMSPIEAMRDAVGLAIATERYGAKFFKNDARPGGVLEHPDSLGKKAQENIRRSWTEMHQGIEGAHVPAVLEEGMKWHQVGMTSEDAQFLQTRTFSILEIARMFNVPPHKLREMTRSTFTNIEHQSIEWVVDTIRPWAVRWEEAGARDLLTEGERDDGFFLKFTVDALLRGDNQSRSQFYREMWNVGVFSINDILELEDRNPVEGGDERFVPLSMIPLNQAGFIPESQDNGRSLTGLGQIESREARSLTLRRRYQLAYQKIFAEVGGRIVRREVQAIKRAIKAAPSTPELRDRLEEFFVKYTEVVRQQMTPALSAYAEVVHAASSEEVGVDPVSADEIQRFVGRYAEAYAARHVGSSKNQLEKIIRESEPAEVGPALLRRIAEWGEKRPQKIGTNEAVQAGGAFARAAYIAAGMPNLTWRYLGKGCPLCQQMQGRTIAIMSDFLTPGNELDPGDGGTVLKIRQRVGHPPLHSACDCMVVAGR